MVHIIKEIPDAKLVILGVGDMDQMLEHMVHNLHLEENVILHFRMAPEEERLLYYAASDVVVLPSKYEPFGIVCTEAMSMGKPSLSGHGGSRVFVSR